MTWRNHWDRFLWLSALCRIRRKRVGQHKAFRGFKKYMIGPAVLRMPGLHLQTAPTSRFADAVGLPAGRNQMLPEIHLAAIHHLIDRFLGRPQQKLFPHSSELMKREATRQTRSPYCSMSTPTSPCKERITATKPSVCEMEIRHGEDCR